MRRNGAKPHNRRTGVAETAAIVSLGMTVRRPKGPLHVAVREWLCRQAGHTGGRVTATDRSGATNQAVPNAPHLAATAGSDGVAALVSPAAAAPSSRRERARAGTGDHSGEASHGRRRLDQIRSQLAAELTSTDTGADPARHLILLQLPNALTVARFLLTPVFAALLIRASGAHLWMAGIVFGVVAFTDQIDGVLARALKAESPFGKIADPLADKLLIGTAVVILTLDHRLSVWGLPVLVARHVLLWFLRFLLPGEGMLTPTWLGKLSAWVLYTSIGLIIVTPIGTAWAGFSFWIGAALAMAEICWYPFRPAPPALWSAGAQWGDERIQQREFTLCDGRRLAYCVIGPANGVPVFFFHGWGQSRLTLHPDLSMVERLGLRLITVDRPGVGLSDPRHGRSLLEWPDDVAALADHLGLGRFSVVGHSAGAPYVAACAYRLPGRVVSGAIVSGIAPPAASLVKPLLSSEFWKVCLFVLLVPWLAKPALALGIRIGGPRVPEFLDRHLARLPAADREVMADPAMKRMRMTSLVESFRQGAEGLYEDAILLRRPWGFELESIRTPIRIWHGEDDNIVPIHFGRELARKLPGSRHEFHPGLGHNMLFSHWSEILEMIREDGGARS